MDRDTALLIIVTGRDRHGVTSRLSTVLAEHGARIAAMEQVVLRGRLVLGSVVHVTGDTGGLQDALFAVTGRAGMQCEIDVVEAKRMDRRDPVDRHHVTMLGMPLRPSAIASVTSAIADLGGNIDRIEGPLMFSLAVEQPGAIAGGTDRESIYVTETDHRLLYLHMQF